MRPQFKISKKLNTKLWNTNFNLEKIKVIIFLKEHEKTNSNTYLSYEWLLFAQLAILQMLHLYTSCNTKLHGVFVIISLIFIISQLANIVF